MENVSLSIDGTVRRIGLITGREEIGAHFRIRARLAGEGETAADVLGKPFALTLRKGDATETTITGIVVAAGSTVHDGAQEMELELGPEHELLSIGRDSHVYLAKTSVDIGKAVLSAAGSTAARWDATAPPARPYTAQYREDDWSFVSRITREDGIFCFYEHGTKTTLVYGDDVTKAKTVAGDFVHRLAHGTIADAAWVSDIRSRTTLMTEAFATRDYDPKKPKLALEGTATDAKGKLEDYDWPAGVVAGGDVAGRAKTALQAHRARTVVVTGKADRPTLQCGTVITIASEAGLADALCKLFVVAVSWKVSPLVPFELTFEAVPSTVVFRSPLRQRPPGLGVETAFVRGASGQEIDADASGDVFVQPPWDRNTKKDDSVTIRSRSGQMQLARSMTIPRIGWSMLVDHRDGDVRRPWVMARLVDGTHLPPYKLPDNMTQTAWQTLTSPSDGTLSEIVYEDKRDAEKIQIHAARDMVVEIGDNEARTVGNNHTLEVTADRTETIDADDKVTVKVDQTTTVTGAETTTIDGSRSITVKGNEEDSVSGKRTETVKLARTTDVGKNRTLTVTGAMTATGTKGFTREVLKAVTATAAAGWTTQADGGLVVTTKGDASETIAAARTRNGKTGMQSTVKGDLKDTIAAAHTVTAKGSVNESSKGKGTLTVGAALSMTAPEIEIVGESEITITCGGTTITIKSSEVSVKTPLLTITGPLLVIKGATAKHNP